MDLWSWARTDASLGERVRRVVSACDYTNGCSLRGEQAGRLFGEKIECSVSQLQEYATCPYRYFASYGLRLRERPVFELAAVELGSFYHRILYRLTTQVRQRGQSLRTVPQEVLDELVDATTDEELGRAADELAMTGGRERYLLERAKADIGAALRGHVDLWRGSAFEPAVLEAAFGMDGGLPALAIETPKGRRAVLRGKIDRIDLACVGDTQVITVIDYKRSSRNKLRLEQVASGLQVQLIAYMKAAMDAAAAGQLGPGAAVPGGMYYFNILPQWSKVEPGDFGDAEGGGDGKQWQLQGFSNSDWLEAFRADDGDLWPMNISVKKNGEPYANALAGDTETFGQVIELVWRRMAETVDRIVDGEIEVNPYKSGQHMPCSYCQYDDLCRFDPQFNGYRPIPKCGSVRALLGGDDATA